MIRLFVALDFSDDIRDRLAELGGGVPGAHWTDPSNMHLTLRFIGNVPDDITADIDAALAGLEASGFDLLLNGVGVYGSNRRARVLWAGVERTPALARLQGKVESALVRCGLEPEERKFSPHVTLARLKNAPKDRIGRFLEERGLFRAGPMRIDHFTLYRSLLGKEAAVYKALGEYPLG